MKNVKRMNEWNMEGKVNEVEIIFVDGSEVVYKGIEERKGNVGNEVIRIDEMMDMDGNIEIVEIKFENGMKVLYSGEKIKRKGNI